LINIRQLPKMLIKILAYPSRLIIMFLVVFLPASLAYGLACFYGDWRCRHDHVRRETGMRNLASILGDRLTPMERARIARDFCRLHYCNLVDMARLARERQALKRLVQIRGLEHLEAALEQGKGAMLCTAHFGSFLAIPSFLLASGIPFTTLIQLPSVSNKSFLSTAQFLWHRLIPQLVVSSSHRTVVDSQSEQRLTALRMANILRANEVIGVAIDAAPLAINQHRTVPVAFLGQQGYLLPGSATIAHRTHTPILMMFLYRSADWRHQVLEISPPISMDGGVEATFGRCVAAVEEAILRKPAHWHYWSDAGKLVELGLLPLQR
jgi:lauroyl/myristoyl acyltransferase